MILSPVSGLCRHVSTRTTWLSIVQLTDFNRRTIGYIRQTDGTHLVFYEPLSPFNFGSQTSIGSSGDARSGFSFHDYCLSTSAGQASKSTKAPAMMRYMSVPPGCDALTAPARVSEAVGPVLGHDTR